MHPSFQRSSGSAFQLSNGQSQQNQQQQQQIKLQQQTLLKRQTQPLSVSQLANIQQQQQYMEAQVARAKLNSHKSFNLEDDLEFYPNLIDTRPKVTRGFTQGQLSPYSTPTKMTGMSSMSSNHRMAGQHSGFLSPHPLDSPQQQQQHLHHPHHQQVFTSPQGLVRRLDVPSNSPMYYNSPGRNW